MVELCPLEKSTKSYPQMRSFQCEDITCAYKNKDGGVKDILRGVTMEVERGQMLAIIGKSLSTWAPLLLLFNFCEPTFLWIVLGLPLYNDPGPSGCGKTCLLDILAQRKTMGEIRGRCYIDQLPVTADQIKRRSSYVKQEDIFYPTQTVMEAVIFQAQLRLPRTTSYKRLV